MNSGIQLLFLDGLEGQRTSDGAFSSPSRPERSNSWVSTQKARTDLLEGQGTSMFVRLFGRTAFHSPSRPERNNSWGLGTSMFAHMFGRSVPQSLASRGWMWICTDLLEAARLQLNNLGQQSKHGFWDDLKNLGQQWKQTWLQQQHQQQHIIFSSERQTFVLFEIAASEFVMKWGSTNQRGNLCRCKFSISKHWLQSSNLLQPVTPTMCDGWSVRGWGSRKVRGKGSGGDYLSHVRHEFPGVVLRYADQVATAGLTDANERKIHSRGQLQKSKLNRSLLSFSRNYRSPGLISFFR